MAPKKDKHKTYIVTGGAGFIGSFFCDLMVNAGHKVLCVDKLSYAGNKNNLYKSKKNKNFLFYKADICDLSYMRQIFEKHQPDGVINFAAETHVDNSISGPEVFIDTNIKGVFTLLKCSLDLSKQKNFRFVQVSTDEVYGSLDLDDGPFTENSPYAPNSPYSASKAAADHIVRAWNKTYGLDTITTHCSNNFGPRQHREKLIPTVINACVKGKDIPIYGSGKNVRDWLYVKDHCNGIKLALEKGKSGETYCFGGGTELSNLDLANKICETIDKIEPRKDDKSYKEQITFVDDRAGHDFRYAIDCSKAEKELGYKPSDKLDDMLEETIRSYLKSNHAKNKK